MATAALSNKEVNYLVHYLAACSQNRISKTAGYMTNWISSASLITVQLTNNAN